MVVTGQIDAPGRHVLDALRDEHPAIALARLSDSPRVVRLLDQLFVVALRRCFAGRDPREITLYVRDLLHWLGVPSRGVAAREAEALIRAVLGEPELARGIGEHRRQAIVCAVVGDLARPPGASPADLQALVAQAVRRTGRYATGAARSRRRPR